MLITDKNIDGGKAFDWGNASDDYAKYRDIYPQEFYNKIISRGLCISGQSVLDLGTGTGVLPRNMYRFGAEWVGADISARQIEQAMRLSAGMDTRYIVSAAENISFADNSFDVITACQCFFYFNHEKLIPLLLRILKPTGRVLLLYMAWLPHEDKIAAASEKLVLKYSPNWSGANETIHPIIIPSCYDKHFKCAYRDEYPLKVHFTREGWHGRVKACRGIGASLSKEEISLWEREHIKLLMQTTPPEFDVLHYAAICELMPK